MTSPKFRDILDRVANTAVYAFVGALPVTITLSSDALAAAGWAGLTAAVVAVITLIKTLVTDGAATASGNIIERFLWTAAQAFVGAIPASFSLTAEDATAIALAGVTAAVASILSLAKNLTAEGAVIEATRRSAGSGAHQPDLGGK